MTVRVLIADDHVPTRDSLRRALEAGGCEVVGEAGNAAKAVELAEAVQPHVAVLDINMPGNGIIATARISERLPDLVVLIWTVSRDDDDLFEAVKAGARGYMLKDTPAERIAPLVHAVAAGDAAMPPALVAKVLDQLRRQERRVVDTDRGAAQLSEREWEVLELLRQGMSTAEIADHLFVAKVTVRSHVAAVLRKLHVSSREEALRLLDE